MKPTGMTLTEMKSMEMTSKQLTFTAVNPTATNPTAVNPTGMRLSGMKLLGIISLLFLFILFNAQPVQAQQTAMQVSGCLIDSLTHEGEPFATLRITKKQKPDEPVQLGVTDIDGKFSLPMNEYGTFFIQFSSVGRSTVTREFSLSAGQTLVDLGIIYITESMEMLGGVEIVAQKPLVKMEVDQISYNVADDPDSKTNTILEMLRKVPMVTVDGEDNIKVNGSSSFQVHINGRPNTMMSTNPSETLKNMPATNVKSIEVLTNPGAKHDAEGVGGILNIRMESGANMEGYTASFSGTAGNVTQGGGVYAMIQQNKLTLSANVNANHMNVPKTTIETRREEYSSDTQMDYRGDMKGNVQLLFGNLDATYEIDSLNSLSASASFFNAPTRFHSNTETGFFSGADEPYFKYHTLSHNRSKKFSLNGSLDYLHTFPNNPKHTLALAYRINTMPRNEKAESSFSIDGSSEAAAEAGLNDRFIDEKYNTLEQTFQLDYSRPLAENQQLEAGAKYILRDNNSRSDLLDYHHNSNIAGIYGAYNLKAGAFGLKAGLRYEHTNQRVKYRNGEGEDFNLRYNNVVPSVSLGYTLKNGQNIGAGYNMRITRPGISYLNPYVNEQDPTHIKYGNPALKPEKAHNVNVNYSLFNAKFMLNTNLRYSFMNNGLEEYTYYQNNVLYSTYDNIGKRQNLELSIFANWNVAPLTRLYVNSTIGYVDLRSASLGYHNSGWQESVMAGVQHTFPWKIRLSANYMFNSQGITLQGTSPGFTFHSLGLSRAFLNDRLNFSITAVNPFYDKINLKFHTSGHEFTNRMKTQTQVRAFIATVSFRIGDLKPKQRKVSRHENDVKDVKDSASPLNNMMMQNEN